MDIIIISTVVGLMVLLAVTLLPWLLGKWVFAGDSDSADVGYMWINGAVIILWVCLMLVLAYGIGQVVLSAILH